MFWPFTESKFNSFIHLFKYIYYVQICHKCPSSRNCLEIGLFCLWYRRQIRNYFENTLVWVRLLSDVCRTDYFCIRFYWIALSDILSTSYFINTIFFLSSVFTVLNNTEMLRLDFLLTRTKRNWLLDSPLIMTNFIKQNFFLILIFCSIVFKIKSFILFKILILFNNIINESLNQDQYDSGKKFEIT